MKQIIWVFGTSAVGADTFMMYLAGAHRSTNSEKLKLSGGKLALSSESLRNVGTADDLVTKRRVAILEQVEALLNTNNVVLVKWQYGDSIMKLPERLKELIPEAKHRIILLTADTGEVVDRRLAQKPWLETETDLANFIETERRLVLRQIKHYAPDFPVTIVDATDQRYQVLAQLNGPSSVAK